MLLPPASSDMKTPPSLEFRPLNPYTTRSRRLSRRLLRRTQPPKVYVPHIANCVQIASSPTRCSSLCAEPFSGETPKARNRVFRLKLAEKDSGMPLRRDSFYPHHTRRCEALLQRYASFPNGCPGDRDHRHRGNMQLCPCLVKTARSLSNNGGACEDETWYLSASLAWKGILPVTPGASRRWCCSKSRTLASTGHGASTGGVCCTNTSAIVTQTLSTITLRQLPR